MRQRVMNGIKRMLSQMGKNEMLRMGYTIRK